MMRNKLFHIWNRFFLLSIVLLSLTVPLINIQVWQEKEIKPAGVIQLLNVVSAGEEYFHDIKSGPVDQAPAEQVVIIAYMLVCLIMLGLLVKTLLKINLLFRNNTVLSLEDFYFINTDAPGTPFSFLKYVFWNKQIEPDSETGQQMLKHELVHVREKHTYDKIFINLVLLVFWSNPVFWFIRREMAMIHEFIADRNSVDQGDTKAFAAMILQSVFPQHHLGITNYFFHSPLKRRLLMLSKIRNPRVSCFSRVLILPVLTLLIAAFTIKVKQQNTETGSIRAFDKPFTLVIDAGHGGDDGGATAPDGTMEKDLNLAIAKKIKALNQNENIKIVLTRVKDIFQDVKEKASLTAQLKPDAFISVHIAAAPPEKTSTGTWANKVGGFGVYVSSQGAQNKIQSAFLGTLIVDEIKNIYPVNPELKTRKEVNGIWVLDAPTVNYPAVLVECGYLTNSEDLAFIKDNRNQEKIARNILDAVQRFVVSKDQSYKYPDTPVQSTAFHESEGDTSIDEIILNLYNKKKVATYLKISEQKIKEIQFKGSGNHIRTIVTLVDNTSMEIPHAKAKEIGIFFPSPLQLLYQERLNGVRPVKLTSDGIPVLSDQYDHAKRIAGKESGNQNRYFSTMPENLKSKLNQEQKLNSYFIVNYNLESEKNALNKLQQPTQPNQKNQPSTQKQVGVRNNPNVPSQSSLGK